MSLNFDKFLEPLEWLAFKSEKEKEKNKFSTLDTTVPHKHVFDPLQRLILVINNYFWCLNVWHPLYNDFNSQMTLDRH